MKKKTTEQFIEDAKNIHGNKYDYSAVEYKNSKTKVKIVCKEHGIFEQTPNDHLNKLAGCNICSGNCKKTTKQFIQDAKHIHGNLYNYNFTNYKNSQTKVKIVCKEHGIFEQTPNDHLQGKRCPYCFGTPKKTKEQFIDEAKQIHGDKYDYNLVEYFSTDIKVKISCKEHGVFEQTPHNHISRLAGCRLCADVNNRLVKDEYIEKARKVHGSKYSYKNTDYVVGREIITITCKKHGDFNKRANSHIYDKSGCQICNIESSVSKDENKLIKFIHKKLKQEVITSDRSLINPLELDIVLPEHKIAIEYNGLYWHSDAQGKDKNYHKNKTELCKEKGYRLIHIFEDDWLHNKKKVKSFLKHVLGVSKKEKIYARKTKIKEISGEVGRAFLEKYHIQGSGKGSIYLGTFNNDTLVAVTSFAKGADNTKNKGMFELTRHTTSQPVIGALGKVSKYFATNYSNKIYTFCDNSYFDGHSYLKAGFKEVSKIKPDYMYVIKTKREHKFSWRRKDISQKFPHIYSEEKSESEMMKEANIHRIWDCGKTRFEYML